MKIEKKDEFCQFCLSNHDLKKIPNNISSIIKYQLSITYGNQAQICQKCEKFLVCFDKFRGNALLAQEILEERLAPNFEVGTNVSFDSLLSWLDEVGDCLRSLKGGQVKKEEEFHEEELFCESIVEVDEETCVKKESDVSEEDEKSVLPKQIATEDIKRAYSDDETLEECFKSSLQGTRRPYECPQCHKHFSKGELKYHLYVHKNLKPFKCVVEGCPSRFSSPRIMRVHAKRRHDMKLEPERPVYVRRSVKDQRCSDKKDPRRGKNDVICSVCGKSVRKKHFSSHFQTHNPDSTDLSCPYKDQGCIQVFRMRHLLTSHIQKKHDASYIPALRPADRICELCGKCFTKSTIKYHMNVHLGVTPYVCDYEKCTESFKDPNLLRQHKRTYHLRIKQFRCRYCPKKIYSQEEYDEHKKEDCGPKSVACEICGKFINKMNIKCHLAIHKGERNWICPEEGCGKAFLLKNKLKQHSRSHSTECNFECTICRVAFKCKQSLTSHNAKKHSNAGYLL